MSIENGKERWKLEVVPKLRFYNMLKESYAVENFVVSTKNRKKRSILSQFRYSILPLRNWTFSRYTNRIPP